MSFKEIYLEIFSGVGSFLITQCFIHILCDFVIRQNVGEQSHRRMLVLQWTNTKFILWLIIIRVAIYYLNVSGYYGEIEDRGHCFHQPECGHSGRPL